ncbi:MAG: ABC transporter ATP-binding protein [Caldilineaceae bacterium]|nr:ABC transporter ATP-binding protein [Caldilineaceae bacterium]
MTSPLSKASFSKAPASQAPVLQVKDLRVYYHTARGPVKAVDGVSFSLGPNMRLGLVGESGSGKSTMALALMRMIKPPGRIEGGQVLLGGQDLVKLSQDAMRSVRLDQIAMIPQGAMNSLNPVVRIRQQIVDGLRAHDPALSKQEIDTRVAEVLDWVDLDRSVANMYPHELSGGMKQRVCIAIAISLRPKVIIADEPTSALDVVIQRQVMETIGRVQEELGAAVILIGHDMGLMVQFVDRLAVMYGGKLAEMGDVRAMFRDPLHPYTQLLIKSLPKLDDKGELTGIPGVAPSLLNAPAGCLFHVRCPQAMAVCRTATPPLMEIHPQWQVACHLYDEVRTAAAPAQEGIR